MRSTTKLTKMKRIKRQLSKKLKNDGKLSADAEHQYLELLIRIRSNRRKSK